MSTQHTGQAHHDTSLAGLSHTTPQLMAFWSSKQIGYGRAFANSVLAAFKTAPTDPLIDTGKLRLSQDAGFQPTPASAIADLTGGEADFSGYPAGGAAVTVTDPVNLDTTAQGIVIDHVFVATTASPFVENTLYGWWIDDGTNVIAYEVFGPGVNIPIGSVGDFLDLAAILAFDLGQGI